VVIFENFAHTLEKVIAGSRVKRVVVAAIGDLLGTFKGAAMNFILRRVQKQVPRSTCQGAALQSGGEARSRPESLGGGHAPTTWPSCNTPAAPPAMPRA
jgi:hypothetical protein